MGVDRKGGIKDDMRFLVHKIGGWRWSCEKQCVRGRFWGRTVRAGFGI